MAAPRGSSVGCSRGGPWPTNPRALDGLSTPLIGTAPEALQVVIRAFARQEYVGQHGVEVEQYPGGVVIAVHRQRSELALLCRLDHAVGDRPDLAVGLPLADDEIVGDRGLVADVDDDRVPRLLVDGGAAQEPGHLQGCRSANTGALGFTQRTNDERRCTPRRPVAPCRQSSARSLRPRGSQSPIRWAV